MNLSPLVHKLRRALVPAALVLLLAITLARVTEPSAASEPGPTESTSSSLSDTKSEGLSAFFQISPFPTLTWTPSPTPIPPTPTDTVTPTPVPPTPTPTDTVTPTPVPPTPTNTPTVTPTPVPPTPTPTPLPLPPEVSALIVQPGVAEIDAQILAGAVFTDPNPYGGTSNIAEWSWGDGSFTTRNNVTSPAQAGHAYEEAGIYTVVFTITTPSGLSATTPEAFVVVYDPSGGFVTGGGWIDSPAGAYYADPSLTGKATFAFVSKYLNNRQAPTGNTEFHFKAAGLNFSSDHYYWLVVNGNDRAIFSGSGTINGQLADNGDPYKFKIWAGDDPDTLRIRIWVEEINGTETDIYDNGSGQPIDGGSIVVHSGKRK